MLLLIKNKNKMSKKFTKMEELVIQSIIRQAEAIAICDTIHYDSVQEIYRELIGIQLSILAGKIDINEAIAVSNNVRISLSLKTKKNE